jgi:putative membrane protein
MAGAPPTEQMPDPHQTRMASLASERTWLAWWRTALAASAGALGVGRLAPEVLGVAPWPYIVLGGGYALVAVAMLAAGLRRQRQLERALQHCGHVPLRFAVVAALSLAGIAIAILTVVVDVAQT